MRNLAAIDDDKDLVTKEYVDAHGGGGGTGRQTTYYTTCSTTASTAAKVITIEGWTPTAGDILTVLFTSANTAATPTLNVNSLGAKSIYIGDSTPNSTTNVLKWSASATITFMYDGTYYRYLGMETPAGNTQGGGTWYGTSSTAATTAAKTSTISNFKLTPGAVVCIKFSTANTYNSGAITLNVNSTGAKTIYANNAATSDTNPLFWDAGDIITFIYSSSYWYFVSNSNHYDVDVLYDNDTGSSGPITLSNSIANYDHMRIYYGYETYARQSVDVYNPSDKQVSLFMNQSYDGQYQTIQMANAVASGTTLTLGSHAHFETNYAAGSSFNYTQTSSIRVYRVEAWNHGSGSGGEVIPVSVLYYNSSGTTGTVTLSQSAANFDHMRIYARKTNDQHQETSVDVYNPNGKYASLLSSYANGASSNQWITVKNVLISGTSITTFGYGNAQVGDTRSGNADNQLAIYRVEAWNGVESGTGEGSGAGSGITSGRYSASVDINNSWWNIYYTTLSVPIPQQANTNYTAVVSIEQNGALVWATISGKSQSSLTLFIQSAANTSLNITVHYVIISD